MDYRSLAHYIDEHFNELELRALCFDLGIDYDDLPGEGAGGKGRELVNWFKRRNKLWVLISAVAALRPDLQSHYQSRVKEFSTRPLVPTAARANGDRIYYEFLRDALADTNERAKSLTVALAVSITIEFIILIILLISGVG